jgi:chemotaxis protein CheD
MVSSRSLPPDFEQGVVTAVHQGDCLVSGDLDLTYSTVLGSCIAACIRDREARVGGMNHFLLAAPAGGAGDRFGASARYGAFAMEQLINKVLTRGTGRKTNLDIKVFGGGLIHGALTDIGAQNIAFVREFLGNEGYRVTSEDLGGSFARRVLFRPSSGRVLVKRLESSAIESIARAELAEARGPAPSSAIELF